MGLTNVFNTIKNVGYVIKPLDQYLIESAQMDDDRRWDINSPSMAGRCCRAIVYSRLNYDRDGTVDPRSVRILNNGDHVHDRLQEYLKGTGILLMDEVPVFNLRLMTQGHTDGILQLNKLELGVLEIKSINSVQFGKLVKPKDEHEWQGMVYMHNLEMRRQELKKQFKAEKDLLAYLKSPRYKKFVKSLYSHLKDGHKFSREEKLQFKIEQHTQCDSLLWHTTKPITKVIFLYECKDDQNLKEFCLKWDDKRIKEMEEKFLYINDLVKKKKLPAREGKNKSSDTCRWCDFKHECWIL